MRMGDIYHDQALASYHRQIALAAAETGKDLSRQNQVMVAHAPAAATTGSQQAVDPKIAGRAHAPGLRWAGKADAGA